MEMQTFSSDFKEQGFWENTPTFRWNAEWRLSWN